ncbi:MAG: glycosyltransferase family 4 protein, partial [Oscillospiraceae bacterium]
FYEQTAEMLEQAMLDFEKNGVEYDRQQIREHSITFSEENFRDSIADYCKRKLSENMAVEIER